MGRFHHILPGNLIRLIRYVTLRHAYTILHYTFLSSVSLVEAINMGTSPMRMDLSWFIRFFDAAMKLDLESSHFYSKLPRCQQRCQPVPCRTWGMTPPGVLSCDRCDGVDLTVIKLGWVSCWHFCLVVRVVANMHHLLANYSPIVFIGYIPTLVTTYDKAGQLAEHTYTPNIVCHPFRLPFCPRLIYNPK